MEPYLNRAADTSAADPAHIVERELTQQGIRDAIQELPEDFRVVIELYYWAEMPQKRMAEFLSLPLTTVKWRLHKAKELAQNDFGKTRLSCGYVNNHREVKLWNSKDNRNSEDFFTCWSTPQKSQRTPR